MTNNWYIEQFYPLLVEIEQGLQQFCQQQPRVAPLLWQMIDHHFGWSDGSQNAGGKRLRPILALLVGQALAEGAYRQALPAALGIEIIHNFTLLHDDIMDQSLERRHRPTVWALWGIPQAINGGDGLFALGMMSVLSSVTQGVSPERAQEVLSTILEACLATVEGQVLDLDFEKREDVTPEEYINMIFLKTGALIRASAMTGALTSTDDRTVIEAYGEFGRNVGIAFQIWDDYLGIWGEDTGKSATSDIEAKKKSYPVLVALQNPATRQRILDLYQHEQLSAEQVQTVLTLLEQAGAKDQTYRLADEYFQRGMQALDRTGMVNDYQQKIRDLAAFFVQRSY